MEDSSRLINTNTLSTQLLHLKNMKTPEQCIFLPHWRTLPGPPECNTGSGYSAKPKLIISFMICCLIISGGISVFSEKGKK